MDRLIGDVYQAPNGKRDVDTLVWKNMFLPVYTGVSPYGMLRSAIKQGSMITALNATDILETQDAKTYFANLNANNLYLGNASYLDHAGVDLHADSNMSDKSVGEFKADRYVHAHGVCGTPVPGGTKIEVTSVVILEKYGSRAVTAHFSMQPGDYILDPSRQLLKDATGANSAIVNFNIPDHASAAAGYPVKYEIDVAPCTRQPGGSTAGLWCSAAKHKITTAVDGTTVENDLYVPEYNVGVVCKAATPNQNAATGDCEA